MSGATGCRDRQPLRPFFCPDHAGALLNYNELIRSDAGNALFAAVGPANGEIGFGGWSETKVQAAIGRLAANRAHDGGSYCEIEARA